MVEVNDPELTPANPTPARRVRSHYNLRWRKMVSAGTPVRRPSAITRPVAQGVVHRPPDISFHRPDFGVQWYTLLNSFAHPGSPESGFFDPITI